MNSPNGADSEAETVPSGDDPVPVDPHAVARVARLLRWYPSDWRARYGDEFETMLYSTLADGKGGLRLSFNVAREGVVARLIGTGIVGTLAPPLKRARISVAEIFVGIVAFLVGTTVLSHYVERWRGYPTNAALERVSRSSQGLIRAETRLLHQDRSLSMAKQLAAIKPFNLEMKNRLQSAYAHQASGAPVFFDRVAHFSVDIAIACLGAILVIAIFSCVKTLKNRNITRLVLPISLLLAAGALFILREIAYNSDWVLGNFGFWSEMQAIMHGDFEVWPSVVFPLCTATAVLLLAFGGTILLRRAALDTGLCRWVGRIAVGAAIFLGCALVSTLAWAATLSVQAPGFLTWDRQGVLGISLLPVFVVAILAMTGACSLVIAASARCLDIVRNH